MPKSLPEKSILNRIKLILTKRHPSEIYGFENSTENVFHLKNLKKINFY